MASTRRMTRPACRSTRRRPAARGLAHGLARRVVRIGGALFVGLLVGGLLLAALAALRLSQGPVALDFLAPIAEREIARHIGEADVSVGGVVFVLGEGGDDPSGLRLTDVVIRDPSGRQLISAPQMGARFRLSDAVRGIVAPSELYIYEAQGRITRDAEGRFDIALPGSAPEAQVETTSLASLVELLEAADLPILRRLHRIRLSDVALTYRDMMSGRVWRTEHAGVVLARTEDGISGRLDLSLADDRNAATAVEVEVHHRFGAEAVEIAARFSGARPGDIADQIPALAWLRPLAAPVAGEVSLDVGLDGALRFLTARLAASEGELRPGDGATLALAAAELDFALDPRADRLVLHRVALDGAMGRLVARGEVDLARRGTGADPAARAAAPGDAGNVTGLEARLEIETLTLDMPGTLAAPVAFDAGHARLRIGLEPLRIEIAESRLARGPARIDLDGAAWRVAEAWEASFDLFARDLDVRGVLDLWPLDTAPGARLWVDERMPEGVVDRLAARLRLSGEAPDFSMTFRYRDAVATPLPGLPPITGAAGTGILDLQSFTIALDRGETRPDDRPIDLAGSVFHIPDLLKIPAEAQVRLKGDGPIGAVLALIDRPPLSLLSKIGAQPSLASGRARLAARLDFPMLRKLTPQQVVAGVEAELTEVALSLPAPLPLSAERLELSATNTGLRVTGPMRVGPETALLDWREVFRPEPGEAPSRVVLGLPLSAPLLEALGAGPLAAALEGRVRARLEARLSRASGTRFTLSADLGPGALVLPGLGWRKEPGEPGTLRLSGRLRAGPAGRLDLDRMEIEAGDLRLAGRLGLDADRRLDGLELTELRLGAAIDSTLSWDAGRMRLEGGTLDLVELGRLVSAAPDSTSMSPDMPALEIAIDRLVLTPSLALSPAAGTLGSGSPFLTLSGPANGGTPAELAFSRAEDGLMLRLTAADAGRFLQDAGYFTGGHGGRLLLDMGLSPGAAELSGRLVIRGLTVRDAPVLGEMLSVASITGILERMTTGGLSFDRVEAHFRRANGVFYLTEGIATGGSLGLTIAGEYDEARDRLALSGVFTPAYLVNGLLGEVPVLGKLLTGERGEGMFGFAYEVTGSTTDPDVSVNPLSILTPGVLRGVLSKQAPEPPVAETPAPTLPDLEEEEATRPATNWRRRDSYDR